VRRALVRAVEGQSPPTPAQFGGFRDPAPRHLGPKR
jgi:hypothetical protein